MEQILAQLATYGPLGVITALLFYLVITMQKKLFSVIENNTAALTKLQDVIDKCQAIHK